MSDNKLIASLTPFYGKSQADVEVRLYVVTGKHGFLSIPDSFCKECNLFYKAVKNASEDLDLDVDIRVMSYWTNFFRPLIKGGYHAPVLIIDGELVSQGYDVPDEDMLKEKIREPQI